MGTGQGVHLAPRTLVTRERLGLSVLGFQQGCPSSLSSHVWPAGGSGLGDPPPGVITNSGSQGSL